MNKKLYAVYAERDGTILDNHLIGIGETPREAYHDMLANGWDTAQEAINHHLMPPSESDLPMTITFGIALIHETVRLFRTNDGHYELAISEGEKLYVGTRRGGTAYDSAEEVVIFATPHS